MTDRYFDDFRVGERFVSRGITFTESAIMDFAQRYDPQPFHLDAEAAAESLYGGIIASGFQTLALAFRVFYDEGLIARCSLGSPGLEDLRWLAPVRPGDTVHAEVEVLETRASRSRTDRGFVKLAFAAVNQRGETVMTFLPTIMLARRAAPD
ncbi:MAG: MaoC family dehydratase [Gammaproteobacteria bacterium]|nr:MaoC family dehydratase [Gammaproteobacteria bacterium]